ncbi:TVP38/TMEM64 family protein [Tepidibacillus infernus]|uniref:TVP38/TMEM64 family protein n=1 Tax=Tepidibacillus TaxID=1494427 RepID=UPI0008534338|nr:TVP38/TMEM64 family protein [Tepidibacillus sp. HK-1]GBF12412.1 TVP38/TMEM64 family inner membrane protein YdjZ [Tepidibacillus sp. HK-1]
MKKWVIIGIVIFVLGYLLFGTEMGTILRHGNLNALVKHLKSYGWLAILISIIIVIIQTFFPFIPFVLLAGANALVFGLWHGYWISWMAAVIGAIVSFLFARYLAQDYAMKQASKYKLLDKLNLHIKKNGFFIFLLARVIPVIPSSAVNFIGGISPLSFRQFFWSTVVGKLPIVFLETLMGHDMVYFKQHPKRLMIVVIIFTLLVWIGYLLNKRLTLKGK